MSPYKGRRRPRCTTGNVSGIVSFQSKMLTTIAQLIQSYALRLVQDTLRQIAAPVKLISLVNGEKSVLYDDPTIPDADKAVIDVTHVNFWRRVLLDFDLVDTLSTPHRMV